MKAGFKSFLVYRLRTAMEHSTLALQELLEDLPAGDPAETQMKRTGFIPPIAGLDDELVIQLNKDARLVAVQTALRVVPNKIVKRELAKKVREWEDRYQRVPTAPEKQDLKNGVIGKLMETALIDYERMHAIITGQYIYIDTTSVKKAELVLGCLRHQLESLPVHPLTAEGLPVEKFTAWIQGTESPEQLTIKEAFKGKAKLESKQVLAGKNVDLEGSSLSELLGQDYQIVALELGYYNDSLHGTTTFVLDEDLAFRSVQWPDAIVDMAQDDAGEQDEGGINLARAMWLLTAGALDDLRDGVMVSLGGEATLDGDAQSQADDAIRKAQDGIFGLGTVVIDGVEVHDPLLQQACDFVIENQKASISSLQRHFRIGYNRSSRIIESLEAMGIIGAPGENGTRPVWKTEAWKLGDTNINTDFPLVEEDDEEGLI